MARDQYKIADETELSEDGTRVIEEIKGTEIAVFKIDGEYHAVANYCPHIAGPLCEGKVMGRLEGGSRGWDTNYDDEENVIVCPWHGWQFDITTGKSCQSRKYAVPTYDVTVEDGEVFVQV